MPFSIAEVPNDSAFAQSFQIVRSSGGYWSMGKWVDSKTTLNVWGSIQPPKTKDLEQVPEADRVTGMIMIHITQPIYETNVETSEGISDIVIWHGEKYRLIQVTEWYDYGYWKAFGVRMSGQ